MVDVVVGLRLSFQEQVDAALRLVGGCKNLSLAQRFAYDHSSTMYSSLYTLVDYAAESVDSFKFVPGRTVT
jgi:hypothetical protein